MTIIQINRHPKLSTPSVKKKPHLVQKQKIWYRARALYLTPLAFSSQYDEANEALLLAAEICAIIFLATTPPPLSHPQKNISAYHPRREYMFFLPPEHARSLLEVWPCLQERLITMKSVTQE